MTSSEEQHEHHTPAANEGGQQGNEGRNRRRRRRGRRPGEARQDGQEGTQQEHSQQGADNTPASNEESQPQQGPDGERRGRNRRRNRRGRGGESSPDGPAEATGEPGSSEEGASAPIQVQTEPAQQQRQRQPQHQPKKQQEKKERPPRGSVLNRRQTRGDFDDAPKVKNEAPAYVPVVAATVESYVTQHKGWQREVLTSIRSLIKNAAPEIEESIMWSQPVFSSNGPICFIKAYADAIHFGFWRGTELDDSDNLLVGGDLIMMRHILIKSAKDIKADIYEGMVRQAARLNRDKGDPTLS
jgi:hypothetical protein